MALSAKSMMLGCLTALVLAAGCGDDDDSSPSSPKSGAAKNLCTLAAQCASEISLGEVDQGFVNGYVKSCLESYDCVDVCESRIGSSCARDWVEEQGYESCEAYCGG